VDFGRIKEKPGYTQNKQKAKLLLGFLFPLLQIYFHLSNQ